jgi:hypothetical protein
MPSGFPDRTGENGIHAAADHRTEPERCDPADDENTLFGPAL